jgi:hypothetical protein
MDVSHDHTGFGTQIPFLGSEDLFSLFDLQENLTTCIAIQVVKHGYS